MYENVFVVLLRAALIETLWVNLTSESHHLDSCEALRDAANNQQMAAESLRKACEHETTYLVKKMWVIIIQPTQDVYFTVHCLIYFFIHFAERTARFMGEEPETSKTTEENYHREPLSIKYSSLAYIYGKCPLKRDLLIYLYAKVK